MGEAARVYAEELQKLAYGHPLWWPEHTKGPGGRERQIEIGDVGYIDPDGAFHALFNIAHEREHELNAGKTPPNFSPLIDNLDELIETKTCFLQPGPQSSSSIKRHQSWTEIAGHDPVSGGGVELSYRFQCSKKQGAILMLWDDAAKTELRLQQTHLMKYMKAHHESWYRFAYETLGINCEREDIILVRGFIKTSCWTVAALAGESDHNREVMLNGQLGPLFNVGVGYASHSGQLSSIQQRSGPITRMGISESMARAHWQTLLGPTTKASQPCDALAPVPALDSSFRDQCVFLNYYKIKYNSRFLRKIVAAAGASDFADPDGSIDREVSGLLVEPSPLGDDVQLQTESFLAKPLTPLDIVLDYILEFSDASIAIASYQDLEAFDLDHWSSSLSGVLRSLSPKIDVQNSIGTLSRLHTCSSRVLPLEIVLLIIMNISNDISALKSCSLVCRSWLSLCQPYLFDTIKPLHGSMNSEQRLRAFHASINTSTNPPHFCNWVRTLRLTGTSNSPVTISTGVFSSILAKLPMIRVLELEQVVITNHAPGVIEVDPPLGQTNLNVLSINLVRLEDLSQNPLASILRLFLSIGMLRIRNLEIVDDMSYPWESRLPLPGLCQVKGLIFETSPPAAKNDMVHTTVRARRLLDAMLESISLCSLQSLETRCHTVGEAQAVGQLIRKAQETLQDIALDLSNIVGESYDCKDIADTLSLHVCKRLHRLCIKVFPDINQKNRSSHQWQRASELLMEVLSAASPSIQSMTIPLRSHNVDFEDHHMINWKALRFLKTGFENLSELIFALTPECRCPQLCERYISSQLPELHSIGLLKFSNMNSFMLQPVQHLRSPCRIPTQGPFPSQSNGSHNAVHYADETLMSELVVPQTCYVAVAPHTQLPSIKFRVGGTLGIKLVDALNPGFTELDNADFLPRMSEFAMKCNLRINWPGYVPWHDVISTLDHSYDRRPLTLKKIAQTVAQKIQVFRNDMSHGPHSESSASVDGWQIERYPFETLVLLELRHASKGSWQPVLACL